MTSFIFPTHLLHEPALSLRGEECVHQVIVRLVRDLERLLFDVSEDCVQHVGWQILPGVYSSVLFNELFRSDFHLGIGIM